MRLCTVCAWLTVILSIFVGLLVGPPTSVSLELLDAFDRALDAAQGSVDENGRTVSFTGIFAPTSEEHPDGPGLEVQLVEGHLPPDLEGVFLRVGPNPWAKPSKKHHIFDVSPVVRGRRCVQFRGSSVVGAVWRGRETECCTASVSKVAR